MNLLKKEIPNEIIDDLYEIEMSNDHKLRISFLTWGACIRKIAVKESNGSETLLNLCYDSIDDYMNCQEYAGMTVGPCAGRMKDNTIMIHDVPLHLTHNEGIYNLHGGNQNLSHQNWQIAEIKKEPDYCLVKMETSQVDGMDGFPGNRHYTVTYTLFEDNRLLITYDATTDQDTYINMTNHTYWNLTGNPEKALEQTLEAASDFVTLNGDDNFPLEIRNVTETIFDFRASKPVAEFTSDISIMLKEKNIQEIDFHQIHLSKGLNHGFLFSKSSAPCELSVPALHRSVSMSTDAPGTVIYSGGFIESGHLLANKKLSCPSCGIALEAQELPTVSSYKLTTPENPFHREIQYQIHIQ